MRNWRFPWSKGKPTRAQSSTSLSSSREPIGDLDNMRTSISSTNRTHQNQINQLNKKIDDLENKLKGLPSTQMSSTQNQNLNNTITNLNNQLKSMRVQKESLQKTIKKIKQSMEKIEEQKTTLKAQVDRLKNQPSVPSQLGITQKQTLQSRIVQLKNQNDRLRKQVDDLKKSGSTSSKTISGSTQKDPEEFVFLLDGTERIVTRKVAEKIMKKQYRELTQSQKEQSSSKPNLLDGIKGGIILKKSDTISETIPTNINVKTAPPVVVTKPTTRAPVPLFNIGKDASSRLKKTSLPKKLTEHQKALKKFLIEGITSKQLDSIASKINKTQQLKTLRQRINTLKENDPDFCAINLSKELTDAITNNKFLNPSFSLVNKIQCPQTKT